MATNIVNTQEYDATSLVAKFHDVSATILIDQVLSDVQFLIFIKHTFFLFPCLQYIVRPGKVPF